MPLLERVSTLIRANLNDLLTKAEDPEKLARQLVLDMENQLMQVKTQVAIAIAGQHALQKKRTEQEEAQAGWLRKAEMAVARQQDDLARPAIERALLHQRMAEGFGRQYTDGANEADTLKASYTKLQQKLTETQARVELLTVQHRRNHAIRKASGAQSVLPSSVTQAKLARLTAVVQDETARNDTDRTLLALTNTESLDDRFASLEQTDQIEALLLELKERQPRLT